MLKPGTCPEGVGAEPITSEEIVKKGPFRMETI